MATRGHRHAQPNFALTHSTIERLLHDPKHLLQRLPDRTHPPPVGAHGPNKTLSRGAPQRSAIIQQASQPPLAGTHRPRLQPQVLDQEEAQAVEDGGGPLAELAQASPYPCPPLGLRIGQKRGDRMDRHVPMTAARHDASTYQQSTKVTSTHCR